MDPEPVATSWSLEEQRAAFIENRFLAMPISGTIVWAAIGVAGLFLPDRTTVWVLFVGTASIFYIGLLIARLTGEDLLGKGPRKNVFDGLFFSTIVMAVLVYAIAIPFFMENHTSLPLTVGILSGLMWVPFSAMIGHWVGYFHGIGRTALVLAAWLAFPSQRFVAIPAVIVAMYLVTIYVLEQRYRALRRGS